MVHTTDAINMTGDQMPTKAIGQAQCFFQVKRRIGDEAGLTMVADYTGGSDKLHMAYCFTLLGGAHDAPFLHATIQQFQQVAGDGWPCWALSNHDVARVATRWGGEHPDPRLLRLAAAFQLSLRGTVCLYQGEELGLPEATIAFEDLQDPYGISMWPEFKGRDGCRTPMPWAADAPQAGFSTGERSWLPVPPEHRPLAVDRQQADAGSLLSFFKQLLHWRREQPALLHGEPWPVERKLAQSLLASRFVMTGNGLRGGPWAVPA